MLLVVGASGWDRTSDLACIRRLLFRRATDVCLRGSPQKVSILRYNGFRPFVSTAWTMRGWYPRRESNAQLVHLLRMVSFPFDYLGMVLATRLALV